jgi:hypothetical protein
MLSEYAFACEKKLVESVISMIVLLLSVVVLEQRNQTGKTDCGEPTEMSSLDI